MNDPANTQSNARAANGYIREVETSRTYIPCNPGRGGSRVYPMWQHHRALHALLLHNDYDIAATSIGCSPISVRRWFNRSQPYRMAGAVQTNNLCGYDPLLLTMCLYIYPTTFSDEIASFILANGSGICSCQDIPKRCKATTNRKEGVLKRLTKIICPRI